MAAAATFMESTSLCSLIFTSSSQNFFACADNPFDSFPRTKACFLLSAANDPNSLVPSDASPKMLNSLDLRFARPLSIVSQKNILPFKRVPALAL